MKVLITGGQGYIARNLVPLSNTAGYEVVAPSRTEMDWLDEDSVFEMMLLEQPDILIHAASKGGHRDKKDTFEDVFIPNMKMFENIISCCMRPDLNLSKIILIGSGAEFDRRYPIHEAMECEQDYAWPIDPYGLSKNIITKRALTDFDDVYVLRLFGCFNFDDDPARFIKNGILNLKRGLPVTVHQNKEMDYFYMDDVFAVMNYIIKYKHVPRHINLVYDKKMTLLDIASLIHKHVGRFEPTINLLKMGDGLAYSGNADVLSSLPVYKDLLGLEEGIRRTANKLT